MKSLKRTLSLVLALVMVLGLFGGLSINAAASNFTDDEEIQYKEAVDVLTAIGAIDGMDDGSFQPKGTIRRADAAKLITYTVLGKDSAEALPMGVNCRFTDVDSNWAYAAPSIEYLADKGVINGMGDGTFHPADPISGYAVAKMLLCALGYGAKDEYTGDAWKLQTAIDASKYGILKDRVKGSANLEASATREEVALYCLNTIQTPLVTYVSALDIYDNGTVLGNGQTHDMIENIYNDDLVPSYAINSTTGAASHKDDLGRPSNMWKYKGNIIGEYPLTPARVYTTTQSSLSTLAADLKGLSVPGYGNGYRFTTEKNGSATATGCSTVADTAPADAAVLANAVKPLTGNGTVVTVFTNSTSRVVAITAVQTDIGEVSTINPISGDVVIELTGASHVGAAELYTISKSSDLYDKVSSLKEGDRVLVTLVEADTDVYVVGDIETPNKITGKVSIATIQGTYTVNDEAYGVASCCTSAATTMTIDPSASDEWDVWVGSNGFIYDAKKVTPDAGSKIVWAIEGYQKVVGTDVVNMAKVIRTSGEVEEIAVDKMPSQIVRGSTWTAEFNNSKNIYELTTANPETVTSSGTEADAGVNCVLPLVATKSIDAGDKRLNRTVAGDDTDDGWTNFYASDVKFIYVSASNGVTVCTGVTKTTNLPANSIAITGPKASNGKVLVVAVIIPGGRPDGKVDTSSIAFNPSATPAVKQLMKTAGGQETMVPVYQMYINGEEKLIPVSDVSGDTAVKATTYYQMAEDSNIEGAYTVEVFTDTTDTMAVKPGAGTILSKIDSEMLGTLAKVSKVNTGTTGAANADMEWIEFKDAKVIDVRSKEDKEEMAINTTSAAKLFAGLGTYSTITVSYVFDKDAKTASTIYVVDVGEELLSVVFKDSAGKTLDLSKGLVMDKSKDTYNVTAAATATGGLKIKLNLASQNSEIGTVVANTPKGTENCCVTSGITLGVTTDNDTSTKQDTSSSETGDVSSKVTETDTSGTGAVLAITRDGMTSSVVVTVGVSAVTGAKTYIVTITQTETLVDGTKT